MKTKTFSIAIATLAATLLFPSCSSLRKMSFGQNAEQVAQTTTTDGVSTTDRQLIEALTGDWTVASLNGESVVADASNVPYLKFAPNEISPSALDFFAYNGCNFLNGVISINNGKIKRLGETAATMKLCADAPYEMAMTSALNAMTGMAIETVGNEAFLNLRNGAGKTLMTLRRHNLNFLEGAWQVVEVAGLHPKADFPIQLVVDLTNGTIHGNGGCNTINGRIRINMARENGITFGDITTTRMSCPELETERTFIGALEETTSVVPNDDASRAYFRNADGRTLIEMRRITRQELAVD